MSTRTHPAPDLAAQRHSPTKGPRFLGERTEAENTYNEPGASLVRKLKKRASANAHTMTRMCQRDARVSSQWKAPGAQAGAIAATKESGFGLYPICK